MNLGDALFKWAEACRKARGNSSHGNAAATQGPQCVRAPADDKRILPPPLAQVPLHQALRRCFGARGFWPLAHKRATFPGVSSPASVVKSIMVMARNSHAACHSLLDAAAGYQRLGTILRGA